MNNTEQISDLQYSKLYAWLIAHQREAELVRLLRHACCNPYVHGYVDRDVQTCAELVDKGDIEATSPAAEGESMSNDEFTRLVPVSSERVNVIEQLTEANVRIAELEARNAELLAAAKLGLKETESLITTHVEPSTARLVAFDDLAPIRDAIAKAEAMK